MVVLNSTKALTNGYVMASVSGAIVTANSTTGSVMTLNNTLDDGKGTATVQGLYIIDSFNSDGGKFSSDGSGDVASVSFYCSQYGVGGIGAPISLYGIITSYGSSNTLSAQTVYSGVITNAAASSSITLTLPSGADMSSYGPLTYFNTAPPGLQFLVINNQSVASTLTITLQNSSDSSFTCLGPTTRLTVAPGTSVSYWIQNTGTNTWMLY